MLPDMRGTKFSLCYFHKKLMEGTYCQHPSPGTHCQPPSPGSRALTANTLRVQLPLPLLELLWHFRGHQGSRWLRELSTNLRVKEQFLLSPSPLFGLYFQKLMLLLPVVGMMGKMNRWRASGETFQTYCELTVLWMCLCGPQKYKWRSSKNYQLLQP